jgi:exopolysaccharide biosynthesis protein
MTIDGKVVNHPSDVTGERPVSDAILVVPATRRRD